MNEELFESIKSVIFSSMTERPEINEESVTLETNLITEMGINSLDVYAIVVGLEQRFNISIPDEEIREIRTMQLLYDFVSDKISQGV